MASNSFVIWKYKLEPDFQTGISTIKGIPTRNQILSVHQQRDQLCVWIKFDPNDTEEEDIHIAVIPTGQEITEDHNFHHYINTVQMDSEIGELVFHAFRIYKKRND